MTEQHKDLIEAHKEEFKRIDKKFENMNGIHKDLYEKVNAKPATKTLLGIAGMMLVIMLAAWAFLLGQHDKTSQAIQSAMREQGAKTDSQDKYLNEKMDRLTEAFLRSSRGTP